MGTNPTHPPTVTGTCPTFTNGVVTVTAGGGTIQAQTWMGSTGGGPLILYWHATGSMATYEVPLAFDTAAVTAAGGVIIGFEATTRTGTPTGNTGDDVWYSSDVAFADQAAACAIQQMHLDPQHIHAAGYSAGALQSVYMWFARSGYLASVISYSGGDVTIDETSFQDAAHAGAALVAHGAVGSDTYDGVDFANASAMWETQIKQAGVLGIDCNDGGMHVDLSRLQSLAPVSLKFFQDHPFGVKPEPYTTLPSGFPSYCKID
jgi:predicted esterase